MIKLQLFSESHPIIFSNQKPILDNCYGLGNCNK